MTFRRKNFGCSFVVLIAFALVGYFLWGHVRNLSLSRHFARVQIGMTDREVSDIMGEPSWSGSCRGFISYGGDQRCNTELGYRNAFAPLAPQYWVIELGPDNKVISADVIVSP